MLGYYEMSKIHGHILTTLFSAIVYNFQKGIEPSISFIALLQRSSKVTLCTTKNEEKQQIHHKIHFSWRPYSSATFDTSSDIKGQ